MTNDEVLALARSLVQLGGVRRVHVCGESLELEFFETLPPVVASAGDVEGMTSPPPRDPILDPALYGGRPPPSFGRVPQKSAQKDDANADGEEDDDLADWQKG